MYADQCSRIPKTSIASVLSDIWSVLPISWNLHWKLFLLLLLRDLSTLGFFVPDYLVWCFCRTQRRPHEIHRQHCISHSMFNISRGSGGTGKRIQTKLCPLFSLIFVLESQTHSPRMILGLQLLCKMGHSCRGTLTAYCFLCAALNFLFFR